VAVETSAPQWLSVAERLFAADYYADEKSFRDHFDSKVSLYHSLAKGILRDTTHVSVIHPGNVSGSFLTEAKRVNLGLVAKHFDQAIEAAAYEMMYGAYAADAVNGNQVELDKMINQYEEITAGR